MSGHELTCREVVELVTSYLDDALDPGDRARFDEHLRDSGDHTAYLERLGVRWRSAARAGTSSAGAASRSRGSCRPAR